MKENFCATSERYITVYLFFSRPCFVTSNSQLIKQFGGFCPTFEIYFVASFQSKNTASYITRPFHLYSSPDNKAACDQKRDGTVKLATKKIKSKSVLKMVFITKTGVFAFD